MTDTVAAAAPAPAPEVVVAPPAQAPAAAPPAPAADDLAAAVAAHQAQIRESAGRTDVSAEVALLESGTPAAATTTPDAAKPAEGEQPAAATTETATEAKPVEETADKVSDNIARYLRQERLARQDRQAAKAEREALAAERVKLEAERAERSKEADLRALAKTNPVAATKALLGDDTLRGNFVIELLNQLAAEESGQPVQLTDAQREAAIVEKAKAAIRAEQEAAAAKEREAAEVKRQQQVADNARGKEAFFTGLATQFKAERDKYPFLAAEPVDVPVIDRWLESEFNRTGKVATPAEIFTHFESLQEARAQRLAGVLGKKNGVTTAQPAAPVKTNAAAAPVARPQDTRGSAPVTPSAHGKPTFKSEREAIIARLEAQSRSSH